MLNELKRVLLEPLNDEMDLYRENMSKLDEIEMSLVNDDSEKKYKLSLKELKEKYKSDRQKYIEELGKLKVKFKEELENFNNIYDDYLALKQKIASMNIYEIQKSIEKINNATKVEELGKTEEEIKELCAINGIEFRIDLDA